MRRVDRCTLELSESVPGALTRVLVSFRDKARANPDQPTWLEIDSGFYVGLFLPYKIIQINAGFADVWSITFDGRMQSLDEGVPAEATIKVQCPPVLAKIEFSLDAPPSIPLEWITDAKHD